MNRCVIDIPVDGHNDIYRSKEQIARKPHICCECGREILPGENYEYVFLVSENTPMVYKTCSSCLEIREVFFCSGYYFESLWEELWNLETGPYEKGIPMCAFNGFSRGAINALSEFFDRVNQYEGDDEDEE